MSQIDPTNLRPGARVRLSDLPLLDASELQAHRSWPPLVAQIIPADILNVIATAQLPEPTHRLEEHYCQWREIPTDGRPVWQCSLTWSDGTPCGSVTIDPMPYHPATWMVRTGSAA